MPVPASRIYECAARALVPLLRLPFVESIYIRRSVAAGEAQFPWSDLDLGLVIAQANGAELWELWRRFRVAKVLFPRLGECQIATAPELAEMADMDPYRASLDRRFGIPVAGGPPGIPLLPISQWAAARRLVFWFEAYLPRAVRQGNARNQRKFAREMANALGVVEGRWEEPRRRRAEAELPAGWPSDEAPFVQCCRMAERAQRQLRPPAPALVRTVRLPGIVLVPAAEMPFPERLPDRTMVVTPAVLDLLLATQNPFLWLQHGAALRELGFSPPPSSVWPEACLRQSSGERFRLPGFGERGPIATAARLERAARVVHAIENGRFPAQSTEPVPPHSESLRRYYLDEYDGLAAKATELRGRIRSLRGQ